MRKGLHEQVLTTAQDSCYRNSQVLAMDLHIGTACLRHSNWPQPNAGEAREWPRRNRITITKTGERANTAGSRKQKQRSRVSRPTGQVRHRNGGGVPTALPEASLGCPSQCIKFTFNLQVFLLDLLFQFGVFLFQPIHFSVHRFRLHGELF